MMTRKDFEAIAEAIAKEADLARDPSNFFQTRMVASAVAGALSASNPRFDREKFMEACRVR